MGDLQRTSAQTASIGHGGTMRVVLAIALIAFVGAAVGSSSDAAEEFIEDWNAELASVPDAWAKHAAMDANPTPFAGNKQTVGTPAPLSVQEANRLVALQNQQRKSKKKSLAADKNREKKLRHKIFGDKLASKEASKAATEASKAAADASKAAKTAS